MDRKTFLCSYLTEKEGIEEVDEEMAIQMALTKAMQDCGCRFIIAPPELVNNTDHAQPESKKVCHDKEVKTMKSTGIIRRVDDLGRVAIPKEIRRRLHLREGDPVELFLTNEGVVFKRYRPADGLEMVKPLMQALRSTGVTSFKLADTDGRNVEKVRPEFSPDEREAVVDFVSMHSRVHHNKDTKTIYFRIMEGCSTVLCLFASYEDEAESNRIVVAGKLAVQLLENQLSQ